MVGSRPSSVGHGGRAAESPDCDGMSFGQARRGREHTYMTSSVGEGGGVPQKGGCVNYIVYIGYIVANVYKVG